MCLDLREINYDDILVNIWHYVSVNQDRISQNGQNLPSPERVVLRPIQPYS